MAQRMSDLLACHARDEFIGRAAERAALRATLDADGPRVIHVHGIAGIGKSALLARFADAGDAATRRILEGTSVARRTTISLLRSLFPEFAPQDAYDRLQRLPFVDGANDDLVIHDAVREAIARSLRASDPSRDLDYLRSGRTTPGFRGAGGTGGGTRRHDLPERDARLRTALG